MKLVVDVGGSISAEHGVGVTKRSYMDLQKSEPVLDTLKAIKKSLDPNHILNPKKVL